MWQSYYQDMVAASIHPQVIEKYADSLSNPRNESARNTAGIYAIEFITGGGYNGFSGWFDGGLGWDEGFKKYFLPHENTHGFQWEAQLNQDLLLFRVFSRYTNDFYQTGLSNPSALSDANVSALDYAIQNEAEWMAELFRGYIYPSGNYHWTYIVNNYTALKEFFDCIWKENKTSADCQSQTNVAMVDFPVTTPMSQIPPDGNGFTAAQHTAIWNVCFQRASEGEKTLFNDLINGLNANLITSVPDQYYELGIGDCNHDGVMDWVCSYKNSGYLWNNSYSGSEGTYTFVASGIKRDGENYYWEYKRDPYNTLTADESLLQPQYRQWQGTYGSCNGAMYFKDNGTVFPKASENVLDLPAELVNKTDW